MILLIFLSVLACFAFRLIFQRSFFNWSNDWPAYIAAFLAGWIGYALTKWPLFLTVINYAVVAALIGLVFFIALNNRNKIPIK